MTPPSRSAGAGTAEAMAVPTARRLAATAAGFVLVPGLVGFVVADVAGVVLNIAGVIGLLLMVAGMLVFPLYLRRVGRAIDAGRAAAREDLGPDPRQVPAPVEAPGHAETTS